MGSVAPTVSAPLARIWILTVGIAVVQIGAGLPASMYPAFRQIWGLDSQAISLFFVALIIGVVLSLVACSQIRRDRTVIGGLVLAAVFSGAGALLFSSLASYQVLLAAAAMQGIAIGLFTGLAPGVMYACRLPRTTSTVGVFVAAANAAGLAAGPLIGGVVDQFAPAPHRLVFWAQAAVSALVAVGALWASRSYRTPDEERSDLRGERLSQGRLMTFAIVAAGGFCAFAIGGLYSSLGSLLLAEKMKVTAPSLLGLVVTALFASNAVFGPMTVRFAGRRAGLVGLAACMVGLAGVCISVQLEDVFSFFAATVVLGAGQGTLIACGTSFATEMAARWRWSGAVSVYFLVCYIGTSVPAFVAGTIASVTGLGAATTIFAFALLVVCLGLLQPWGRLGRERGTV